MKRRPVSFFIFLLFVLCYTSCQENESSEAHPDQALIDRAKTYFNRTVNVPGAELNAANSWAQLPKELNWENAYLYELYGNTAVAVPILYDEQIQIKSNITNRSLPLSKYARLLIYQDKANTYHAEVVTLLPEPGYSGRNGKPFAGIVFVEDWYGNRLKQLQYTREGQELWLDKAAAGGRENVSGRTQLLIMSICVTVQGWNYSEGDPDGYHWSRTTCEYFVDGGGGSGGSNGGGYGGSGGGGGGSGGGGGGGDDDDDPCGYIMARQAYNSGPTPPPPPTPTPCQPIVIAPLTIVNDVENPCISALVDKFKNSNAMVQFMFDHDRTNTGFDLIYLDGNQGGLKAAVTGMSEAGGYKKIQTTMNKQVLAHASKEFIMATIIHEMLHAFQMVYFSGRTEEQEHNYMTNPEIFGESVEMLQEQFPSLSEQDAIKLMWLGLEETTAYNNLSAAQQQAIQALNQAHKYTSAGSPCP